MRRSLLLVPVLALSLAGCGGGGEDKAEPPGNAAPVATSEAPVVTVAPTPTEISKEAAGAQYLALVEPSNVAAGKLRDKIEPTLGRALKQSEIAPIAAAAGTYADALRAFSIGLQEAKWPANAQAAVTDLVGQLTAEQSPVRLMSRAKDAEDMVSASDAWVAVPDTGASERVRQALGLPERPVA